MAITVSFVKYTSNFMIKWESRIVICIVFVLCNVLFLILLIESDGSRVGEHLLLNLESGGSNPCEGSHQFQI